MTTWCSLGVDRIEPVVAPLVAPALGGLGLLGAAGAGAAALVGGVGGSGGGGGGGGGDDGTDGPTVNDADGTYVVAEGDPDGVTVSGTGEPGSEVSVDIGGSTGTTTVGDDGTWTVDFPTDVLPADGDYETVVTVVDPEGTTHELDGPTIDIDMTPPEVEITAGTQSVGDVVNAEEQSTGTIISGTGEAGATVALTIGGETQTTTVGEDGSWSVTFNSTQIGTGEYSSEITIVTTDPHGNSTTTTDTLVVDTLTSVTIDGGLGGADGVVNASEAAAGFDITGTAEAGASVVVTVSTASGDITRTVTADDSGNWTASIAGGELSGDYTATVSVAATDLAGNTATSSTDLVIDTVAPEFTVTSGTQATGDFVNEATQASGTVISGTGEAGATLTVDIAGQTQTTTVGSDGNWSVTFSADQIAPGTRTDAITITSSDAYGNTSSDATQVLAVDTETTAAFDDTQAGDNIVSAGELAAGITITGTAEAGSTVSVTVVQEGGSASVTRTATADADGNWSVTYEPGSLPEGEYNSTLTLTSTDAAGNEATDTHDLRIDTYAGTVEITDVAVTNDDDAERTDGVINDAERDGGVTVTGSATAGEEVTVTLGTATGTATADADGNWSYTFDAADIPEGTDTLDVTATITDEVGNTASDADTVGLDTEVTDFATDGVSGGNTVNRAELEQGFELTGTVEAGSSVTVEINGVSQAATVAADGSWTVNFDASVLTGSDAERDAYGEYSVTPTITATDAAGNTTILSPDTPLAITIDTEVDTPAITGTGTDGDDNLTSISVDETSGESFTVNTLETDGTAPQATATEFEIGANTMLAFDDPVADGTNLLVTNEDAAGNQSSTMVMFEDNATETSVLNHAGAAEFNIDTLNLEFADQVNLTLTEADINALSGNSDTLTIRGNSDDTVTVTGATQNGTREVEGETFEVWTVGDGGTTLLVEEDVQVVI